MFESILIENVRNLREVSIVAGSGANYLFGENGSGKTSVLEALHLLGFGRTFRAGSIDGVIRTGEPFCRVVADVFLGDGHVSKIGLERRGKCWQAKVDGVAVEHLSSLLLRVPILCLHPGSADALLFDADVRRRMIDWGVFHVEPSLLRVWRDYVRALRQRNAALRVQDEMLASAWEPELSSNGERIHAARVEYLAALSSGLTAVLEQIAPELKDVAVSFRSGWAESESLGSALEATRSRDLIGGFTSSGPHRGDLRLQWNGKPFREIASRGQAKAYVLSVLLAQATWYRLRTGRWPTLLFDDVGSELDTEHQSKLATWLEVSASQVWFSGLDDQPPLLPHSATRFHVKQGEVTRQV